MPIATGFGFPFEPHIRLFTILVQVTHSDCQINVLLARRQLPPELDP